MLRTIRFSAKEYEAFLPSMIHALEAWLVKEGARRGLIFKKIVWTDGFPTGKISGHVYVQVEFEPTPMYDFLLLVGDAEPEELPF